MTFLVISLLLALTCFTNGKSVNQSQIFGEPFDKLKIFSSLLQNPSNMTEPSEKYSGGITCNYYWSGSSNLLDQSTSQNTQYCPPGLPCFSGTGSRGSTWFKVGGCVTRLGNAGYSAPVS
uniref:Secreted protein n=1 Tax=Rhabditophanes sp. KR3021 TaxID=114890 RepID=A0AC35UFB1_9BILA